jgi:hypothetical protein
MLGIVSSISGIGLYHIGLYHEKINETQTLTNNAMPAYSQEFVVVKIKLTFKFKIVLLS